MKTKTPNYFKIEEFKKLKEIENNADYIENVTRSVVEDLEIKIQLMKEAQEYGKLQEQERILKIIDDDIRLFLKRESKEMMEVTDGNFTKKNKKT